MNANNVPSRALALPEFVAMLAFLSATIAFSIDAMLSGLPVIAAELTPENMNRAQLVLTSFMVGLGLGTLVTGPISDAVGRKRTITIGFVIYAIAAAAAIFADSLEFLLIARFFQGIGAAGPRIVTLALVRDLYSGREMARITSFVMMVFIIVPAMAPAVGAGIIWLAGWRGIFAAFILFAIIGATWLNLRQPETLPPQNRRPLKIGPLMGAARQVLGDRQVMLCTLILSLGFGQMFSFLSPSKQIFGDVFGIGDSFPLWFALMALLSGSGTLLNARFVVAYGMRRIARWAYVMQTCVSSVMLILLISDIVPQTLRFPLFFAWSVSLFFMAGVTFGNLNALAMVRMGHVAGMTASLVSALSTIAAMCVAIPVGLLYNHTIFPVVTATLICSGTAWFLMRFLQD